MSDPAKRADELRREIRRHTELYYVADDPEIADDEYDALLDELRAIERDNPGLVMPDSPTQRVGAEPVGALGRGAHPDSGSTGWRSRSRALSLSCWIPST